MEEIKYELHGLRLRKKNLYGRAYDDARGRGFISRRSFLSLLRRLIIYCRGPIVVTPKIEGPASAVSLRFAKWKGSFVPYDSEARKKRRELFDPSLVKPALLSTALWRNRSSVRRTLGS